MPALVSMGVTTATLMTLRRHPLIFFRLVPCGVPILVTRRFSNVLVPGCGTLALQARCITPTSRVIAGRQLLLDEAP